MTRTRRYASITHILIILLPLCYYTRVSSHNIIHTNLEQTIVTQPNTLQIETQFNYTEFENHKGHLEILEYIIGYGLTEKFGIQTRIPILLSGIINNNKSKGIFDVPLFATWNFYKTQCVIAQLGLGFTIPCGSISKRPNTGTGSYNPYFNFAAIHESEKWFAEIDIDAFKTTGFKEENQKIIIGSSVELELDFGRFISVPYSDETSLYIGCMMQGIYLRPTFINKIQQPNFGRQTLYIGPNISISNNTWSLELVWAKAISRKVHGIAPKPNFKVLLSLTGTFN